ncbi:MAG: NAD(+)/NADH kinase [Lachnospiraceae bacterium]|nr:NAD(+)/NADH kinase [Lachnospiraceae bacterium]
MNKFFIITNSDRDKGMKVTNHIKEGLTALGMEVKFNSHHKTVINGAYTDPNSIPKDTDCVIVVGGDGTIIDAARDTEELDIPILGVNVGKMGFLADVELDNLDHAFKQLIEGNYVVEERMMLCGTITDKNGDIKGRSTAINDVVVNRRGPLRVVEYGVWVNNSFLSPFTADGIIICTPTGSTGYSLSAGGPIIEPMSKITCITPICPHTLNTRSIVLSDRDIINIRVNDDNTDVNFDGRLSVRIDSTDCVEIKKSDHVTKIVRINEGSFLTALSNKFRA